MSDHKERTQLLGDFLREGAVLIAVLYPLEAYIAGKFDWDRIFIAEFLALVLLYWGMILEGRDEI